MKGPGHLIVRFFENLARWSKKPDGVRWRDPVRLCAEHLKGQGCRLDGEVLPSSLFYGRPTTSK